MRKLTPVHTYAVAVCVVGLALFVALVAAHPHVAPISAEALLFGLFVLLGELLPITVPRQGEQDQITTSTTFALALISIGCASQPSPTVEDNEEKIEFNAEITSPSNGAVITAGVYNEMAGTLTVLYEPLTDQAVAERLRACGPWVKAM